MRSIARNKEQVNPMLCKRKENKLFNRSKSIFYLWLMNSKGNVLSILILLPNTISVYSWNFEDEVQVYGDKNKCNQSTKEQM